ncbi:MULTISPECIES: DUF3558 domain-containing protein [Prauserella salsuginis group]|uniref:DUF3558 domain-containing protein n=1 Tax=Prauserella salsuginis TaxID=387889 RepID=A0ABW6FZU9_9PSEU|nr:MULTISPECIES: DUF3558 domain-containing protein [Prauserella salsuginis group]MCR3720540.1 Protein of unknown function (DUF3558) [Prauserella flava]MCR3733750.1 Protein of unknown function (DUF3558) [Prauserella salsuginis]
MRLTRPTLLPLVAIAAVAVTACSNSEGGIPEADAGSSPARSSVVTSPSADDETGPGTSLSDLDPCSLLNQADVRQFGPVEEAQREEEDLVDSCSWEPDRSQTSGERGTLGIVIRENAGLQDMNDLGMGVQRTEEDGRQYARVPDPNGCGIAIGVTNNARVDILVTGADPDKACEMANTLAEVVEPKVPQG